MKGISLSLPPLKGLAVLEFPVFGDERGFFTERFHQTKVHEVFAAHGATEWAPKSPWVQVNHSRSAPGVLRGLHYQMQPHPQGKWVMCLRGTIFDVAVDLRPESPTQGQWHGEQLSGELGRVFWIPAGFAHGFYVLPGSEAEVLYLCDSIYSPAAEAGVRYDDPAIAVQWPNAPGSPFQPTLSPKDLNLPRFAEFLAGPRPHF